MIRLTGFSPQIPQEKKVLIITTPYSIVRPSKQTKSNTPTPKAEQFSFYLYKEFNK